MSHQASVEVGALSVPWGIIVAVALTAALLAGLRLVFETRIVPCCAAGGMLLAAGILALPSQGGSILVPESAAGYVWSFAPALIAAIVLGVPSVPLRMSPSSATTIEALPVSKGSDLP